MQATVAVPQPVGSGPKRCNACSKIKDKQEFLSKSGLRVQSYCKICLPVVDKCRKFGVSVAQVRAAMQDGSIDTVMAEMDQKPAEAKNNVQRSSQDLSPVALPLRASKKCTICTEQKSIENFNNCRRRGFFADSPLVENLYCASCR